jgi:putative transposase
VLKFGPTLVQRLRRGRPRPGFRWHLDEIVVRIGGEPIYLWRAVDHEGEVLDLVIQRRRDQRAATKLMRKLLKRQGFAPTVTVTDKLKSRRSASSISSPQSRNTAARANYGRDTGEVAPAARYVTYLIA